MPKRKPPVLTRDEVTGYAGDVWDAALSSASAKDPSGLAQHVRRIQDRFGAVNAILVLLTVVFQLARMVPQEDEAPAEDEGVSDGPV